MKNFSPWNPKIILTAMATSQAIAICYASILADGDSPILVAVALVRGALLGMAVSFGLAATVQKIPTMRGFRRWLAIGSAAGLMTITPVVIAAAFLWSQAAFHILAAVGLDLAAFAVAVGSGKLEQTESKPATRQPKVEQFIAKCPVASCNFSKICDSEKQRRATLNGHASKHKQS